MRKLQPSNARLNEGTKELQVIYVVHTPLLSLSFELVFESEFCSHYFALNVTSLFTTSSCWRTLPGQPCDSTSS